MQVSSTSSQDPGTRSTVSRPMSSVSGARPVANSAAGDLHGDSPVAVQPPVAADQVGAEALQSGSLPLVVPASYPLVPAGEDGRDVHRPGDRLECPRDPAGVGYRDDRPEHRLAGNAGPVGALAPDQFPFHGRHCESRRARPGSHGVPDRPGADDDHVVYVLRRSAHAARIDRAGPQHIVKTDS